MRRYVCRTRWFVFQRIGRRSRGYGSRTTGGALPKLKYTPPGNLGPPSPHAVCLYGGCAPAFFLQEFRIGALLMTTIHIPPLGWAPRPHQRAIWDDMLDEVKNILVVGHRRFGKSELMLNDVGRRAAMTPGNYFYMFPEQEHARRAMMKSVNPATGVRRIDEAFPEGFRIGAVKEQEMVVEVRSAGGKTSVIQFLGSDNYDAVRGASPFGVYLDEWAECDPQALVVLRPIVEENGGYFRFLTTPKGENHVWKQFCAQQGKPDWAVHYITAHDTTVYGAAQLATIRQETMDLLGPELGLALFQQEYLCAWHTVTPGSYYLDLLMKAEAQGRMVGVLPVETEPVYAAFDLGWSDPTAIWYVQVLRDGMVQCVGYEEITKTSVPDIIRVLREKSWTYGAILLPHDGAHHELTSGETCESILTRNGFLCYVMPQMDEVTQIASVRMLLPLCIFNPKSCERGLTCLKAYHNKYRAETESWSPRPVHNWASHGAKAFATLAYFAKSLQRGVKGGVYARAMDETPDRYGGTERGRGLGWMTAWIGWLLVMVEASYG